MTDTTPGAPTTSQDQPTQVRVFVAFASAHGFGHRVLELPFPPVTGRDLEDLHQVIEQTDPRPGRITILSWQVMAEIR
jgi:hypothetical protein